MADAQLKVEFNGSTLQHNKTPKMLGVKLDRTFSFKEHLEEKAKKLSARNNLIQNLAGTSWGANAEVLRTAVNSFVISTADYCSPMWLNSSHCYKIDVQINKSMRIVSDVLKSTQLQWLPVLSNIIPSKIRRQQAFLTTVQRSESFANSLLHDQLQTVPLKRLSRTPPYETVNELRGNNFQYRNEWKSSWNANPPRNSNLVADPSIPITGSHLKRRDCVTLNRIRTDCARTAATLHKWGYTDSTACDCGYPIQTLEHILQDCPLRRFNGTLEDLHLMTTEAVSWIQTLDITL